MISPLAFVDPAAQLGQNVEVGPFAYIEAGVTIGDHCVIKPHASILKGTTLGHHNTVYQNAVVGATPQDFHYVEGQPTRVVIGNHNHIRENVVIAGSIYPLLSALIDATHMYDSRIGFPPRQVQYLRDAVRALTASISRCLDRPQ